VNSGLTPDGSAPDELLVRSGGLLMLADALFVAVIGVLLYAVARAFGERIALGYPASRIVEAVGLAVGVVSVLLPVAIGGQGPEDAAALTTVASQGNAGA
jgi:hypothetical protein